MKMKKILSLLLALLMIASCIAGCTEGTDTTDGKDTTDGNGANNDSNPPTDDLTTNGGSQGGYDPSTKQIVVDFETDKPTSIGKYMESIEGLSLDPSLSSKGTVRDGMFKTSGALYFLDEADIITSDAFSIEFDFKFEKFTADNFTCLCLINEADGANYSGASLYNYMMITDSDGSLYHNNAQGDKYPLDLDTVYNFKAIVNNASSKTIIYINGIELCSADFTPPSAFKDRVGFRLMGGLGDRGVFYMDNLVISAVDPDSLNGESIVGNAHYATDGAFVRDGGNADTYYGVTGEGVLELKSDVVGYNREVVLKFDITGLDAATLKHVYLYTLFQERRGSDVDRILKYDIYAIDPDGWDSSNVTYSTMPKGEKICSDVELPWISDVDVVDAVKEALNNGQTQFSIRLVAKTGTEGQQKLWFNAGTKPYLLVSDGDSDKNYVEELVSDEQANQEIWDRAQEIYDAWDEHYNTLLNSGVNDVEKLKTETNKTGFNNGNITGTYAGQSNLLNTQPKQYTATTVDNFTDLDSVVSAEFKNAQRDQYGGIMVESLKQKATGYFYTVQIDGRWWLIDPLGYPFIASGMSDVHYAQLGSPAQQKAVLEKYGSYTAWAQATVTLLKELGFTNIARPVDELYKSNTSITYILQMYDKSKTSIGGLMAGYGSAYGLLTDGNGSTVFKNNDTMPVFDPEFEDWADTWCEEYADLAANGNIIGFMSDNELPMAEDLLERYLGLNPNKEENYYSYAAAWTWFKNMTGKDNPSRADVTPELKELFRGFIYDRYFSVVQPAVKKYAPNHMYLGVRYVTRANDAEWVMRVSSLYLDCMTINWYDALWEPDYDGIYKLEKWFGKPFIVTEFYAKGAGSLDQDGKPLPNDSGAGIYTQSQEERGLFYQSYVIRLLESRNCVGWEWFQYMDNATDTGTSDLSSEGANKGIVSSTMKEYTELTAAMKAVNEKMYQIANYFVNKNK